MVLIMSSYIAKGLKLRMKEAVKHATNLLDIKHKVIHETYLTYIKYSDRHTLSSCGTILFYYYCALVLKLFFHWKVLTTAMTSHITRSEVCLNK